MKCLECGHDAMVDKVLKETLSYGRQTLTLHKMHGHICAHCGEGIWDEESYRRYTEALADLVRAVKGNVGARIFDATGRNSTSTRESLHPHSVVGKMAFSRYERGETRPPSPLVKLLKLIDRYPYFLNEMRNV